jgi:hypothetical protein
MFCRGARPCSAGSQALMRPEQDQAWIARRRGSVHEWIYAGRLCLETGESRNASVGKRLLWRCDPSNQAHSTTSFPSAAVPTTVTVIRGLPDFNWTVSPILNPIVAPNPRSTHKIDHISNHRRICCARPRTVCHSMSHKLSRCAGVPAGAPA